MVLVFGQYCYVDDDVDVVCRVVGEDCFVGFGGQIVVDQCGGNVCCFECFGDVFGVCDGGVEYYCLLVVCFFFLVLDYFVGDGSVIYDVCYFCYVEI